MTVFTARTVLLLILPVFTSPEVDDRLALVVNQLVVVFLVRVRRISRFLHQLWTSTRRVGEPLSDGFTCVEVGVGRQHGMFSSPHLFPLVFPAVDHHPNGHNGGKTEPKPH